MMAFMMKKKRYKFIVQLCVEDLTAVPFLNAVLFIKLRLLDGGNFSGSSSREEVRDHMIQWEAKFKFECKMSANASTGVLEPCILRISVRKELKGGKSFQKLGFTDLNLAEFAGCGETTRRCLLEGYDSKYRQDNSMLRITINMNMLSGDVLFKVPSPSLKQRQLMSLSQGENSSLMMNMMPNKHGQDDCSGGGSIGSGGLGHGGLTKKRSVLFDRLYSDSNIIPSVQSTDSTNESSLCANDNFTKDELLKKDEKDATCHSYNSLGANHFSKLSHLRQNSSGESASGHARTLSASSYLSETGFLDQGKSALERRRKAVEENVTSGRVEITRVNTDTLIEQLIMSTNLEPNDEATSSSGLQLFISKDGTTTLGGQDAKHQISLGVFKKVIMEEHT